jgi:DNA-binding Lrp family transcriptional regulator
MLFPRLHYRVITFSALINYKYNYNGGIKVVVGFMLVSVSPLRESEVFDKLSKLHEVIEVHPLFGEYDIIVKIEAKEYDSIGEIVIHKIRTIAGILFTSTLTGLKFH